MLKKTRMQQSAALPSLLAAIRASCCAVLLAGVAGTAAADVVKRPRPDTAKGQESDFNGVIIEEALKRTQKTHGAYYYAERVPIFARDRLLDEMLRGDEINITVVATQPLWEEKLIAIRIPIDMGLSGYRLSLIHRGMQNKLSAVTTLQQLKALTVGAGEAWSSRKVFDANGFAVVTGQSFDPLLKMLLAGRFDYFPRGLNEAFPELDARQAEFADLRIEQSFLIEFPLPTYIFVSPEAPRLAKRIEEGMESMVRDGTLQKIMLAFNADMLARTDICSRRIFRINNPMLTDKTPLSRKELWFDPFDPKTGECSRKSAARRTGEKR